MILTEVKIEATLQRIEVALLRIAEAIERLIPPPPDLENWATEIDDEDPLNAEQSEELEEL
jgi:hypothetical protein